MSTACGSHRATVHRLYPESAPPKKRRGRPPKWQGGKPASSKIDEARYYEFEEACKRVPTSSIPAAKEWVADRADKDRLSPAARAVLNFLLRRFNWAEGCDWHSDSVIAEEKDISLRTVERGRQELRERGYIVMQPIPAYRVLPGFKRRPHGTRPWQTTMPIVVDAVADLGILDPAENTDRTRQENDLDPTNNCLDPTEKEAWTRQETHLGPVNIDGQILRETQKRNTKGRAQLARRRLTAIDASAELSEVGLAYATDHGLSREQALVAFQKFKRNALKKDHRFANWGAAWEEWVDNEKSFAQSRRTDRASAADIASQAFNFEET